MILVVGLGNPEKKFEKTRHNIGFRVIDAFFKKNRDAHFFSDFKNSKKLNSLISKGTFNDQKIILAKPQTFMNLSGKAVKKIIGNWKLEIGNLIVVHDDIDLPLGKIKISKNRGSAGHKGVESIIKELKAKNFIRFRLGIQPKNGKPENVNNFVLKNFNPEEEKLVNEVIKKTIEDLEIALNQGLKGAMSTANQKL